MADWKIARKGGACHACERSFEEGEAHLSLLFLRADEPLREDLCQSCFEARSEEREAVSVGPSDAAPQPEEDLDLWWWRTRYRGEKRRGLALNVEAIEGLFLALEQRAAQAEGTTLSELRYILCLILMRKRRLKIVRILRDRGGEAMTVRRPRRKESLRVAVHDFTPERTEELRTKLVRLFDGDEADLAELAREREDGRAPVDGSGEDDGGGSGAVRRGGHPRGRVPRARRRRHRILNGGRAAATGLPPRPRQGHRGCPPGGGSLPVPSGPPSGLATWPHPVPPGGGGVGLQVGIQPRDRSGLGRGWALGSTRPHRSPGGLP